MKRNPSPILCGVLSALLLILPVMTGCTTGQIVSAVQKVETGLKVAKNLIPEARNLLSGFKLDEAVTAEFSGYLDQAGPAIDDLIARCDTFVANPGSDAYQSLLNAFYDFTSKVNGKAILLTVRIKNAQSQEEASKWFSRFSTAFTVGLAILQANASSKQTAAVPKTAKLDKDEMRKLFDREYARDFLTQIGYDEGTARAYGL